MLTQDEVQNRIEFAQNHSFAEWAEKFALSITTAKQWYSKYNISSKRKITDIDLAEIKEYMQTHNMEQAMKYFHLSRYNLSKLLKLHNIKSFRFYKKDLLLAERKEILKDLATKYSKASIARLCGLSRERVRQLCNQSIPIVSEFSMEIISATNDIMDLPKEEITEENIINILYFYFGRKNEE